MKLKHLAKSSKAGLALGMGLLCASPAPLMAQSYPIDCAILLCLAGGWPSSVPCTRARAEFIRRITPWPVEPPLQIWNCPMHASFPGKVLSRSPVERLWDVLMADRQTSGRMFGVPAPGFSFRVEAQTGQTADSPYLQLAQAIAGGQADIDISGGEFDFVRSIKVWHIEAYRYSARQCATTTDRVRLGTYDLQGAYQWQKSSTFRTPAWMRPAWLQKPPTNCRALSYRAVGVEWVDHFGNSGHEVVTY